MKRISHLNSWLFEDAEMFEALLNMKEVQMLASHFLVLNDCYENEISKNMYR